MICTREKPQIFFSKRVKDKKFKHRQFNQVAGKFLPFPTKPYSQEGLEKLLESYFDDITLAYFPKPHGCIAGAVARQIFEKKPDKMVLFTSGNDDHRLVTRILKASADAPILFQTPFEIADDKFIDGGVGGNCPLQQALPKVPELFGTTTRVELVVSIAPPKHDIGAIPDNNQWKYWIEWFPNQVSDGSIVYHDCKEAFPTTTFERLLPESEDAGKFKLDEIDVGSMMKCMEESVGEVTLKGESTQQQLNCFERIVKTACKLVFTSSSFPSCGLSRGSLSAIKTILMNIGKRSEQLKNFKAAIDYCKWILKVLKLMPKDDEAKSKIVGQLGLFHDKLGQHKVALRHHHDSLHIRQQLYGKDNDHPDIAEHWKTLGFA